jgi:hypothetical protein
MSYQAWFHGMLWQTNFPWKKHQQSSHRIQKWRKIIEIKMNKKQKFVCLVVGNSTSSVEMMVGKISGASLLQGISNHMNVHSPRKYFLEVKIFYLFCCRRRWREFLMSGVFLCAERWALIF